MKTFLEISILCNSSQQELLLPTMIELGCDGFQQLEDKLLCYIDKTRWTKEKYDLLLLELKNILKIISVNSIINFREFDEENWNEKWERSLEPIKIGNRFVIKPSWCEYENLDNRIIIKIDPKMSFGTGYHETTRLCLQLLEKFIYENDKVLDVGTGTGILAIASIKLGAAFAVGIDNDDWSINNAIENVTANAVEGKVEIKNTTLSSFSPSSFDLITANLSLNTIIEMLPEFHKILRKNKFLLLSGLLKNDRELMSNALNNQYFQENEIISENEWIAIAAKKI